MKTLTELAALLNELQTTPKKRLSQNFLIDGNIVNKIIQTAAIHPGDSVLEIGPGPGHLTQALLEKGATVHAIEIDPIFAKALSRLQTADQRLHIYLEDALAFPLKTLPFQKVVANLPYQITTPLLERLFETSASSFTLMVQKELADRIFANSGTKDFGLLTLFTQSHTELETKFNVPPQAFFPKPSVHSSVIHLTSRKNCLIPKTHFPLLRAAFQKRRKMLSTSLQNLSSSKQIKQLLESLHFRTDARPEMLSIDQWILFLKKLDLCMVQVDEPTCRNP